MLLVHQRQIQFELGRGAGEAGRKGEVLPPASSPLLPMPSPEALTKICIFLSLYGGKP
ncbi:hypothetical protein Nos7524_5085 [Nostoc sp. PCC 7524]|nr:hypothetical protein Nos7524_5085 [Nostoc sp. PCC 7524]